MGEHTDPTHPAMRRRIAAVGATSAADMVGAPRRADRMWRASGLAASPA